MREIWISDCDESTLPQPRCMVLQCAVLHTMPAECHRVAQAPRDQAMTAAHNDAPVGLFGCGRGLQAATAPAAVPAAAGSVPALPSEACLVDFARGHSRAILRAHRHGSINIYK